MTPADPTSVVLNVAAKLRHHNALDANTLRRLAKSIDTVETLIDNARHLSTHDQHALSKALGTVTRPVDWDKVKETLRDWAVEKKNEEKVRSSVSKQVAPLWNLQMHKKLLSSNDAHICDIARIGDEEGAGYLLHVAIGTRNKLVLLKRSKHVTYSLEPEWKPILDLVVHREGQTLVPLSRLTGAARCRLVCLERKQTLVEKAADYWIQPVGLLYHRGNPLFLIACGKPSLRGISHVDIASLTTGEPAKTMWHTVSLSNAGHPIWSIGGAHAHGDEVRAVVETNRGLGLYKLFARLKSKASSSA